MLKTKKQKNMEQAFKQNKIKIGGIDWEISHNNPNALLCDLIESVNSVTYKKGWSFGALADTDTDGILFIVDWAGEGIERRERYTIPLFRALEEYETKGFSWFAEHIIGKLVGDIERSKFTKLMEIH